MHVLSDELHECLEARCRELTLYRRCAAHATDQDRREVAAVDRATVRYVNAQENWAAALRADDPTAVVDTARVMREARQNLDARKRDAGMKPGGAR